MTIRDDPPDRYRRLRAPSRRVRPERNAPAVAAAAALLLGACSFPHATAVVDPAPQGPYVALGDSYTSGPDIPDQVGTPAGCDRSNRNYPSLLARHLDLPAGQVHDVSCSGAKIANLTAPQTTGNGTNPAQISELSTDTALVTLGVGGNDIDFTSILTRCVELDAPATLMNLIHGSAADAVPCRAFYTAGGKDQVQQKIQTASTQLAAALTRIRQLSPHAHVYVIGYPELLPAADGTTCARHLGLTPGDVAYLDDEERQLNSMLKQQAAAAGDDYVDTYTASAGRDACSDPATRWIEPLVPDAQAAPMHPNARGQQGIADAVEHAVSTDG
jgi:lysophospholipase L1-like esterase